MKIIYILIMFFLAGCVGGAPSVRPNSAYLKDATQFAQYNDVITITGGGVNENSVSVEITPEGSGIKWRPHEEKYILEGKESVMKQYHKIVLYGVPDNVNLIHVKVSGYTLGTMYPGEDFSKDYLIKVH